MKFSTSGIRRFLVAFALFSFAWLPNAGAQWTAVGPNNGQTVFGTGSLPSNSQGSDYTCLAVDSLTGTVYIAYSDLGNSSRIAVKKFDGTNWVFVGAPFFSTGAARYVDLAIDPTGVPYVVYVDGTLGSRSAVKRFDGTNWVNVGPATGVNTGNSAFDKIAFSRTGNLYIAFVDYSGNINGRMSVMTFNGTTWSFVGAQGFSSGVGNACALEIDPSGTPYLAFGNAANANRLSVVRYNGTAWTPVGPATGISAAAAVKSVMTLDGAGMPYVAYADATQANRLTAKKWDGTAWVTLGTDGFTAGPLSLHAVYNQTEILLDPLNMPVVAYVDAASANKVTAMRFNGTSWGLVGNAGFSTNANNTKSVTLGRYRSTLYCSFVDMTNWTSTAMRFVLCNPSTAATITATPAQVCAGQGTTLQVTAGSLNDATAWVWHRDSCNGAIVGSGTQVAVVPTATTTYYVRGEGGCTSGTPCTAVQVTVLPLPAVPVITYVNGGLQSSYPAGNQWFFNGTAIPGATQQTYAPGQTGNYTVAYTNSNGCQSSSAPYSAVVSTNVDLEAVEMWPNPAKKYVRIKFPTIISEFYVTISSMESKRIMSNFYKNTGQIMLNIESLQPGVYLVKVLSTNGSTKTFRLIKGNQ